MKKQPRRKAAPAARKWNGPNAPQEPQDPRSHPNEPAKPKYSKGRVLS